MELIEGHNLIKAPSGVPVWDVDPYSTQILADPIEYYAALRSKGPFVYLSKYSILACGRYEEVKEVFSDHERFVSSRGIGLQDFNLEKPWRPPSILLEADPPYHTQNRRVLARVLSPKVIQKLKVDFRASAEVLIDQLLELDSLEAVTDLAEAFPVTVFSKAVGLAEVDRRRLVDYGSMVFNGAGPDNDIRRAAMARGADVVPWVTEQCRRDNLTADGIGAAIYAATDTDEISENEAGMLVRSLLSAGIDTTVSALASALLCLARNPNEFSRLRANPKLARPAFEETLRHSTPIHSFCRTARVDAEVAGVTIQEGTKILCVLGAANLDEAHWGEPSRFDITRRTMGHLAFGVGIHGCVGQNLSRAEGEAVLGAVAKKVGQIELIGEPVWRPNNSMHSLDILPLRFNAP